MQRAATSPSTDEAADTESTPAASASAGADVGTSAGPSKYGTGGEDDVAEVGAGDGDGDGDRNMEGAGDGDIDGDGDGDRDGDGEGGTLMEGPADSTGGGSEPNSKMTAAMAASCSLQLFDMRVNIFVGDGRGDGSAWGLYGGLWACKNMENIVIFGS